MYGCANPFGRACRVYLNGFAEALRFTPVPDEQILVPSVDFALPLRCGVEFLAGNLLDAEGFS